MLDSLAVDQEPVSSTQQNHSLERHSQPSHADLPGEAGALPALGASERGSLAGPGCLAHATGAFLLHK